MDIIIDTVGDDGLQQVQDLSINDEKPYFIDKNDKLQSILELFNRKKEEMDSQALQEEEQQMKLTSKTDVMLDTFFEEMNWTSSIIKTKKKPKMFHFEQLDLETGKLKSNLGIVDVDKEMKKSVLQPGMEQQHRLPKYDVSDRTRRILRKEMAKPLWRRKAMDSQEWKILGEAFAKGQTDTKEDIPDVRNNRERMKTRGYKWFNLPAPEITEELRNDLQVLKMRSVLDPKHFYKKNDMEALPKYFQVGTVMDSSLDHVNERLTRKQRKRTMVDELLADADFQKYNKKKYKEIIVEKRQSEYKTFMKDKRQKNKASLKTKDKKNKNKKK